MVLMALSLSFSVWAENGGEEAAPGQEDSCQSLKQERQQLCDEAARQCIEVYKYDAFNKIAVCAHYSQRCSQAGREEDEACSSALNTQMTVGGRSPNRVANPRKTL